MLLNTRQSTENYRLQIRMSRISVGHYGDTVPIQLAGDLKQIFLKRFVHLWNKAFVAKYPQLATQHVNGAEGIP